MQLRSVTGAGKGRKTRNRKVSARVKQAGMDPQGAFTSCGNLSKVQYLACFFSSAMKTVMDAT